MWQGIVVISEHSGKLAEQTFTSYIISFYLIYHINVRTVTFVTVQADNIHTCATWPR